jgi:hypothetical protein
MIQGLYSKLNAAHVGIAKAVKVQRDGNAAAADLYAAQQNERRLREEIKKTAAGITTTQEDIEGIEQLITYMRGTEHQSPDRTLAIRALEEASGRLRRELGDHPSD